MRPYIESSDVVADGATLAERMGRDGYLFIKGLLPAEPVLNLRHQLLPIAAEAGWLDSDYPVDAAIANPAAACVDPEPKYVEVLKRMYVLEDLHALAQHPAIVGLFERMFGEEALVHPLVIARNIFPQRPEFTTRAHQDYVHIQGTAETFAIWVPLGDYPMEAGGLQIASGSHKEGVRDFKVSPGAGGLEVIDPLEGTWVSSGYEIGDIVIFHSMVVHKGLPNLTNLLRQSMDVRYQRASEPVTEVSMKPYANMFSSWDEVYAGWSSDQYKYHWRKHEPEVLPFDMQYYERRDAMAYEMAAEGDETARAALLRIVQRDPNPDKRAKATRLLSDLDERKALAATA